MYLRTGGVRIKSAKVTCSKANACEEKADPLVAAQPEAPISINEGRTNHSLKEEG